MLRRLAIVLALALGLSSPASAGWDEALTTLNARDHQVDNIAREPKPVPQTKYGGPQ